MKANQFNIIKTSISSPFPKVDKKKTYCRGQKERGLKDKKTANVKGFSKARLDEGLETLESLNDT